MLNGCTNMVTLNTTNHCCCKLTRKEWVFGIIFEVSSTKGASMNIYCRCQPYCYVIFLNLGTSCFTDSFYQLLIP